MNFDAVTAQSIAIIFGAITAGGLAKGVTGFGLPLVAVPVLASFLGVERAVVIMVIPGFLSNVVLLWEHRRSVAQAKSVLPFLAAGILGAVGGTWVLKALSGQMLALVLAAWVGLYLLTRFTRPDFRVSPRVSRPLAPMVGFVAGCSQGATGASGPVIGTWFHALRLEPSTYVFSVCAIFATFGLVQMVSMASFGLFTGPRLIEGAIAVVPAMIGVPLGVRLGRLVDRATFDKIILAGLAILELRLIWQGVAG